MRAWGGSLQPLTSDNDMTERIGVDAEGMECGSWTSCVLYVDLGDAVEALCKRLRREGKTYEMALVIANRRRTA
jgi:hypothetical protein